jgi:hypothetical protein
MTSIATTQIPGYVVGTWDIDASHSTVGFSVRHMMVSKVRGYFRTFSGEIVTAEDPAQSTVTATIDMDSIDTRQEQRDAHIRSADFFDVGNHTVMTFRSTGVRTDGADWHVDGELTAAVLGADLPAHPAALLQPGDRVGEPAAGGQAAVGELAHPQRPALGLRQLDQDLVVGVGDAGLPGQLAVQPVLQEHPAVHGGPPGALLVGVEPPGRAVRRRRRGLARRHCGGHVTGHARRVLAEYSSLQLRYGPAKQSNAQPDGGSP